MEDSTRRVLEKYLEQSRLEEQLLLKEIVHYEEKRSEVVKNVAHVRQRISELEKDLGV